MTIVGTSYVDTYAYYQVGYDLLSQSQANNTSTVRFYGVLNVTGSYISWSNASASVWGTTWSISNYYSTGSYTLVYQDATIYHNNDGTYSGTLSGTLSSSWAGGTASGTFSLPTIARYPVLKSGTNFTDEENPVYTITNPDTTHVVRVKLEAGGNTQLITRDLDAGYSGTYTLELTDDERNTLRALTPNSNTLAVIETVCAMDGDTELNSSYKSYTMSIVNAAPTFTASYEDTNSTTLAITDDDQQIIRNNSTLEINIADATALKYATLSTLECDINGTTYTGTLSDTTGTIDVGTLNLSSNTRALIYLGDSRGYQTMVPLTLEILDWQTPTGIVSVARQNNYYSDTDVLVDANYSSLDSKNVLTLKVRSKKIDDESYGEYTTLSDNVTTTISLDNTYQWDVQVLVQDLIGSTTYNLTIDRGIPIVFFDRQRRSMGINRFPENDTSLEINGDLIVENNGTDYNILTELNNKITQGEVLFSDENGSTATTITLSSNWANYSRIEIVINNGQIYSVDTDYYSGGEIRLSYFWHDGTGAAGTFGAFYILNNDGNLEYVQAARFYEYIHDGTPTVDMTDNVYIYKVIGYE